MCEERQSTLSEENRGQLSGCIDAERKQSEVESFCSQTHTHMLQVAKFVASHRVTKNGLTCNRAHNPKERKVG